MKKKVISLMLAAAMCVGMMAGCGNQAQTNTGAETGTQTGSETGNQSEASSSAAVEEPQELTEITIYMRGGEGQLSQQEVIDAMNEYSAEKIGVTINYNAITSGEYKDKITMGLAAQEDFDLMWMASYTNLLTLCEQEALMDITDLLPEYEGLYNVMPEDIWNSTEVQGRKYFIPNYKESFTGIGVVTPKALADTVKEKYGIDFNEIECDSYFDIGNYEDYILACMEEGVSVPLPNMMKLTSFRESNYKYECLDNELFYVDKETHKVYFSYDIPEHTAVLRLMEEWQEKGIWKEEMLMSDFKADPILQEGSYALMGWNTVPDNYNNVVARYGVDVYIHEVGDTVILSSSALGSGWSISGHSEKADACLKWLELLNTDTEFADLFAYGIEGKHYTRTADGVVDPIADSGWGANALWKLTNYKVPSLTTKEASDKKEQYEAANNAAVASELLGFRADYSSLSTEMAGINALHSETKDLLAFGFYGMENYESLIAQFREAGVDKVVEELQTQVDAFFAGK